MTNLQGQNWKVPPRFSTSGSATWYFNFLLGGSGFAKWSSTVLRKGFWSVGSWQGHLSIVLLNNSGSNFASHRGEGKHGIQVNDRETSPGLLKIHSFSSTSFFICIPCVTTYPAGYFLYHFQDSLIWRHNEITQLADQDSINLVNWKYSRGKTE